MALRHPRPVRVVGTKRWGHRAFAWECSHHDVGSGGIPTWRDAMDEASDHLRSEHAPVELAALILRRSADRLRHLPHGMLLPPDALWEVVRAELLTSGFPDPGPWDDQSVTLEVPC